MIETVICGTLTFSACALGFVAGIGWHRTDKLRDAAVTEQRRLHRWVSYYRGQAETLEGDHRKASEERDLYASRWGKTMRLLRIAESANKELRTELVRRQTSERLAA